MAVQMTRDERVAWWQEARFGLFIHFGLYAAAARHEWVKSHERIRTEDYAKYFDHFDPDLFDPKKWARTARQAGMRYFVITTKHHEGFCLFDSQYTDYKVTNTPYGRELIGPMVEAFRGEGLKVGFYYSLIDWHHPEFPVDNIHPQRDDQAFREAEKGRNITIYRNYLHNQTRELIEKYDPDIMWFDFSYPGEDGKDHDDWDSAALVRMIRNLKPTMIINNRLDLPEETDFSTPEQFVPIDGERDAQGDAVPWEACQTFSGSWGYHRDESMWKSTRMLVEMLIDNVSKGGNLLLNVGPTGRGAFDDRAMERLETIGRWMRYHARSIYGCGPPPEGVMAPRDCRYTYNAKTNRLYLHLFTWPFKAVHLEGMADRVTYAQLLNDASEIQMRDQHAEVHAALNAVSPEGALTLDLPVQPPDVEVPVVELSLK